jgi:genome maintenance exonuclease 1
MKLTPPFPYVQLNREDTNNGRFYLTPNKVRAPSVTTILGETKSEESKQALEKWKERVGHGEAKNITKEASDRGTLMHGFLEKWTMGAEIKVGSNLIHKQAWGMAKTIIDEYLEPNLNEAWANEASLYYEELYAGTTDLVSIYGNKLSIVDYKQTNKPKKDAWIEDYLDQLGAYSLCHDWMYNTNIEQGVILMCSKDFEPQTWVIDKQKLEFHKNRFLTRVEQYYELIS